MTHKERALDKLENTLQKDVLFATELAASCTIAELMYFMAYLNRLRTANAMPDANLSNAGKLNLHTREESVKYILSLIAKYGRPQLRVHTKHMALALDRELTDIFMQQANYIHSKYDMLSMCKLFDVACYGEQDRYVRLDMSALDTDPEVKKLYDYYLRIDFNNEILKNFIGGKETLFEYVKKEYMPVGDLFEQEMGITVEEFCWLQNALAEEVMTRVNEKLRRFEGLPEGIWQDNPHLFTQLSS